MTQVVIKLYRSMLKDAKNFKVNYLVNIFNMHIHSFLELQFP